jgi:hypothetical protein
MGHDTGLLFDLPTVGGKKVSATFGDGRITCDGGWRCWPWPTDGSAWWIASPGLLPIYVTRPW